MVVTMALGLVALAASSLVVDERDIELRLGESETAAVLSVENGSHAELPVEALVELVDPQGVVYATGRATHLARPGRNTVRVVIEPSLAALDPAERAQALLYRLRYRVEPASEASLAEGTSGVVSVSEITRELFELRVIYSSVARAGTRLQATVLASHPTSAAPVRGVAVRASLGVNGEAIASGSATTDARGLAFVELDLPSRARAESATLAVRASKESALVELDEEVQLFRGDALLLTTDKKLYQPGQTLHLRLLAFDAGRRAIAGAEARIRVRDPEDQVVFGEEVATSRFGVAAVDWDVPDDARGGDYFIEASLDEGQWGYGARGSASVRVSRYELPEFAVDAAPARAFYLPGENASIEVRARYLFGEPLTRARVRVAEAPRQRWSYRERRWVSEERLAVEGRLDASGRFVAEIDLEEAHGELGDYARSADLDLTAAVTDETTGRTEERRFRLRVSREPIHVYTIGEPAAIAGRPSAMYVSTFTAGGDPAPCDVAVTLEATGALLATARTNRYGVAQIEGLRLPDTASSERRLRVEARDDGGRSGHTLTFYWEHDGDWLVLDVGHTLHRPGEAIHVALEGTRDERVLVQVAKGDEVLQTRLAELSDGRAELVIDYEPYFAGALEVVGMRLQTRSRWVESASRPVVYPKDTELEVIARPERARYAPGEGARVSFEVRGPDGEPVESALGVVVVDEALLERERTDEEFGESIGFRYLYEWLGLNESLSGVSRRDIERLDPETEITEELDLVAEILLRYGRYYPSVAETEHYWSDVPEVFAEAIERDLAPLQGALAAIYTEGRYPESLEQLDADLAARGLALESLLDPWESSYAVRVAPLRDEMHLTLTSSGPDEQRGTEDDFVASRESWKYFERPGRAIDRALRDYHERTGGYIRSRAVLKRELADLGVELDALRDPWGEPYRFELDVEETLFVVDVMSGDVRVWRSAIDYFAEIRSRIEGVLRDQLKAFGTWPDTETAMAELLEREGTGLSAARDPWGRGYYLSLTSTAIYGDRTFARPASAGGRREVTTPRTLRLAVVRVRSRGPGGAEDGPEHFTVAEIERLVGESEVHRRWGDRRVPLSLQAGPGAIRVLVTDESGAVLPGVDLRLHGADGGRSAVTSAEGDAVLADLPPGEYTLLVELAGFTPLTVEGILVPAGETARIDASLRVADLYETVTVTGEVPRISTAHSVAGFNRTSSVELAPSLAATAPIATPRLRQFFPETLVWQPELVTGEDGRGELRFELADSVTTWNLEALASTVDGLVGTTETKLVAFQPFFLVHDPPKVLTEGDRIELPVVLRNYLDEPLELDVKLAPEPWFESSSTARREALGARESRRTVFPLDVVHPSDRATLRVDALGAAASDAVEKSVEVRPDGEAVVTASTRLLADVGTTWTLELPEESLEGSARAALKIYPNLMAHVLDSVDGIRRRPHGCIEQQISAAYPSALLLKYAEDRDADLPGLAEAKRHVDLAYRHLEQSQHPDGGISYWGRSHPDVAVTAYALRFLEDAAPFVDFDRERVSKAERWLLARQREDGSWPATSWDDSHSERRDALVTAVVAAAVASRAPEAARRASTYLAPRAEAWDEPYLLASFAQTARELGDVERAERLAARLRELAQPEGDLTFWDLQTNTPFYGWGEAGRIETTALVVRALAGSEAGVDALVERGLLFLLRRKDPFGAWYTTQATVQSAATLLALVPTRGSGLGAGAEVEVFVNDSLAEKATLPDPDAVRGPLRLDLSSYLDGRENVVTVKGDANVGTAASLVSSYYRPWRVRPRASGSLALDVRYASTDVEAGASVDVHIDSERVGFRGYGMMLAEIGLPPGAEVDRDSLDEVVEDWGHGVYRYEVQPDRVVLYLWPQAAGSSFSFRFRPRFAMRARTQPSLLYDFYNPEERTVVPPVDFRAR